jgi:hypothetical protein
MLVDVPWRHGMGLGGDTHREAPPPDVELEPQRTHTAAALVGPQPRVDGVGNHERRRRQPHRTVPVGRVQRRQVVQRQRQRQQRAA